MQALWLSMQTQSDKEWMADGGIYTGMCGHGQVEWCQNRQWEGGACSGDGGGSEIKTQGQYGEIMEAQNGQNTA